MYKAIGHCRVSKGDKEEIKNSLDSQKNEITKLAISLGLQECEIKWYIEEEARSSYSLRSDWSTFEKAINEACTTPSIKYFLDYSQDRFCRSRNQSQKYKAQLKRANVKVKFVTGNVDNPNSTEGFILECTNEMLAELYSRIVGKNTLRGCKQNAITRDLETGYAYKNGGSTPFWLKSKKIIIGHNKYDEPIKKVIWVENDEVFTTTLNGKTVSKTMWEWARYYFIELRLNQKLGIDKARDVLNELGIPAPRGTQWATTCLYSAERNVSLIGTGMYNKRQFGENAGGRIKDKKEWIIIENAHPALLTPEEFKGLEILRQNKLKRSGSITKFQSNNTHLLIGYPEKFTCACCGHKIISSGNVYTCGKYNTNGKKGYGASYFSVNCEWLENKILQEILKMFTDSEIEKAYFEFVKLYKNNNDNKKEIKNLECAINKKTKEQNNLLNTLTSMSETNQFTIKLITDKLNTISEELENLKNEYAKYNQNKEIKIPSYNSFKQAIYKSKMLLTRSNSSENKEIIWEFVNSIKLDPIKREVHISFNSKPFGIFFNKLNSSKTKKEGDFAPSMKMVAGAGFEPTTFGL